MAISHTLNIDPTASIAQEQKENKYAFAIAKRASDRARNHTNEQRAFFFGVGEEMIARGADVVMLAGTDLCLTFNGHNPGFPMIDNALVHIDALFETSVSK